MKVDVQEYTTKALDEAIDKIAHGDMQALSVLYDMTHQKVYGLILSMLKNQHDAQDILHDCYVNIVSAAPTYKSKGRPLYWILGIARNLCLLKIRERNKLVNVPYEDWEESIDSSKDISVEEKMVIHEFMSILSDEERQIIYLHAVAGYKHREIAHTMQLALPTVLSKYHRAIKKLRHEIEKGENLYEQ